MANSTPRIYPGRDHGANARLLEYIQSNNVIGSFSPTFVWSQLITADHLTAAATSQTLTVGTAFPNNKFPKNVIRKHSWLKLIQVFAGGSASAMVVEAGDAADPNGLVTSSDIFTGATLGPIATPAAAEYAPRPEAAMDPTILFTCTGDNVQDLTTGKLAWFIAYELMPQIKES